MPASMKGKATPGTCRWCGLAILGQIPLAMGHATPCAARRAKRITWHPACVTIYRVACFSGDQRSAVKARDHGICARCGVDTERMYLRHDWWQVARRWDPTYWSGRRATMGLKLQLAKGRYVRYELKLRNGMKNRQTRAAAAGWQVGKGDEGAWWQADHILPLIEAEGRLEYFLLSNLRTLCTPCHNQETKALAGRRAADRKARAAEINASKEPSLNL